MEIFKKRFRNNDYIVMNDIQDVFQFPNFRGTPNQFGSTYKSFTVELTEDQANFFKDEGVHVNEHMQTNTDDPHIVYRVTVYANFDHLDWYPVEVHLADKDGANDTILNPDQCGMIDDIWKKTGFTKVDIVARKKPKKTSGEFTLYLYMGTFWQDDNPFGGNHTQIAMPEPDDEEEVPFA